MDLIFLIKESSRDYYISSSRLQSTKIAQVPRPLKDLTKVRKATQEACLNECFPIFRFPLRAAKKLGFQIRRVKRAGCMFSAANQTPTAGVENGNKDQIPLHSMIGLNDGFT